MSGNPLFIGIYSPFISPPLISMLRTQHEKTYQRLNIQDLIASFGQRGQIPCQPQDIMPKILIKSIFQYFKKNYFLITN